MRHAIAIVLIALAAGGAHLLYAHLQAPPPHRSAGQVLNLVRGAPGTQQRALAWLRANWQVGDTSMLLEAMARIRSPGIHQQVVKLLETHTGQHLGGDIAAWYHWLWAQPEPAHPGYAWFKGALFGKIDPRFVAYFDDRPKADIRLDEIRWGGVRQNGIPPLRDPAMLAAAAADYLDAGNRVFGIDINGDARAYPKRILGHHELFTDTVGGIDIAGVYCTLCNAMIVYETDGRKLGTSGFLYRSNKLMFDADTDSLWSTLWGRPVVGPLVGKIAPLKRHPVVTSTWGEWRRRHPDTQVLDIQTGYRRDYSEGAAYHDYFATDKLMFTVPQRGSHGPLPNKAEVLALRIGNDALAITADFLADHRVYRNDLDGRCVVVITDDGGASRAYAAGDVAFSHRVGDDTVVDSQGRRWSVTEGALVGPDGRKLARLPAHRAFWFGWKAAFNDTRLVD